MDLTFQTEYNEDRSARVIARAWAVRTRGATILSWGMGIAGLIWLFGHVMDVNPEGDLFWCFFLLFYSFFAGLWRRLIVRWYRRAWRTQMGGAKAVNLHLTDDFYECSFGESLSKMPWRTVATSYLFMDDAVVLFLHKSPRLVFEGADLRAGNVNRAEFEVVLRNAGMKSICELRTRKVGIVLSWLFGLLIILSAVPRVCSAISTRVLDIRTTQVQARLFRDVHGATTNCPYVVDATWPSRLVSSFLETAEPDECLYIFDDEEEEDKVGIFARYGERSYEAYFPCGCACEHLPGYFDHIKELHKSTVFLESEKEKWFEKVRPIAKDLYVPEDEEDGETCEENVLTSAVDAKTVEERTAAAARAMKQLQVKEFEAKTGEEIAQVVARLHELAKPGLPGLPSERSGISILLKGRPQEREQAEVLRKGFRVEDVSFYDVVGAFCAAAGYEFKVDGGYLRIAPTGTGFPDIDRCEPTDEEQ